MATKRSKRIDPNDAFNTIVGIQTNSESQPNENVGAPEKPMGEGREGLTQGEVHPVAANASAGFLSAIADRALAATPKASPAAFGANGEEHPDIPETGEALASVENDKKNAKKLVQKGYYLTEEQVRKLGIAAVMQGVDRSSIVRSALELYFQAYEEAML